MKGYNVYHFALFMAYNEKNNNRVSLPISVSSLRHCCPHFNALFFFSPLSFLLPRMFLSSSFWSRVCDSNVSKGEQLICTQFIINTFLNSLKTFK